MYSHNHSQRWFTVQVCGCQDISGENGLQYNVWSNNLQKMKQFCQHIRPYPGAILPGFYRGPSLYKHLEPQQGQRPSFWGGESRGESQNLGKSTCFLTVNRFLVVCFQSNILFVLTSWRKWSSRGYTKGLVQYESMTMIDLRLKPLQPDDVYGNIEWESSVFWVVSDTFLYVHPENWGRWTHF